MDDSTFSRVDEEIIADVPCGLNDVFDVVGCLEAETVSRSLCVVDDEMANGSQCGRDDKAAAASLRLFG